MMVNPDYLPMLLDEPVGRQLIVFAVIWASIGIFFIRRIIQIEI